MSELMDNDKEKLAGAIDHLLWQYDRKPEDVHFAQEAWERLRACRLTALAQTAGEDLRTSGEVTCPGCGGQGIDTSEVGPTLCCSFCKGSGRLCLPEAPASKEGGE